MLEGHSSNPKFTYLSVYKFCNYWQNIISIKLNQKTKKEEKISNTWWQILWILFYIFGNKISKVFDSLWLNRQRQIWYQKSRLSWLSWSIKSSFPALYIFSMLVGSKKVLDCQASGCNMIIPCNKYYVPY